MLSVISLQLCRAGDVFLLDYITGAVKSLDCSSPQTWLRPSLVFSDHALETLSLQILP